LGRFGKNQPNFDWFLAKISPILIGFGKGQPKFELVSVHNWDKSGVGKQLG
jgi:hypothetical protein